ncbi:MAG: M3 family oligoendopeptidase [Planctomycetales bacterium]
MVILQPPPRWDVSSIYSGLEGTDYCLAVETLKSETAALETWFTEQQVGRLSEPPTADDDAIAAVLEEAVNRLNEVVRISSTLDAFVYAFVSTDSHDQVAARELSKLETIGTRTQQLGVRLRGWLGSIADRLPSVISKSETLAEHKFFLQDEALQSEHLMSEDLEELASELALDGGQAFGKLQGTLTSQLTVPFRQDGEIQQLPVTVVHNLCYDSNPDVRKRAYEAEIEGWKSIQSGAAACLNGVKGTAIKLARRRKWPSVLHSAMTNNRVDEPTLDALMGAIRDAFPVFRRYLIYKAQKLRKPQLAWWDMFAPLGAAGRRFSWKQTRDFIVEQFGVFTPELGAFAARAFDENWIDAEAREGKRGGAFCMPVVGVEESRVLANFDGSFENVSTMAHELGHAFHNECHRGLPPLLRATPSTLAETASIFCETLITQAALKEASGPEKLMILESQLSGATQVCLDISSRFIFESNFISRREENELSPEEICGLMRQAQQETYDDAVDPETYHPYMWLWKPHYYSHTEGFYNFPYAFGHLFGLGLYARYLEEGEAFVPQYNALLRATGQDWAGPLAARFGIDIASKDFWKSSLRIIEEQVEAYAMLPT